MKGKLAIIVPVRNGGTLLHTTVHSCGLSAISGAEAEVLVFDNCSEDRATDGLPTTVGRDIPVRVIHNDSDFGRVGNWNRGVQLARERGFEFATFLFVGDTWVEGDTAAKLLDLMRTSGSDLGLAQYLTIDESGRILRNSARISFTGATSVLPAQALLHAMMRRGHLPITPLQANIYRLRADNRPEFDERRPLTTDLDATLEYVAHGSGSIALIAQPLCAWLARKGRVFCTSGLESFMADHFRQLRYAETLSGCPVDWSKAKSVFLLGNARSGVTFGGWRSLPGVLRSALSYASCEPGVINPIDMATLVIRHLATGRSSLHVG